MRPLHANIFPHKPFAPLLPWLGNRTTVTREEILLITMRSQFQAALAVGIGSIAIH